MSREMLHQSPSDRRLPGHRRRPRRRRPRSPPRSRACSRRPSPASRNGPGASRSGGSTRPSSRAARPEAVIQSLAVGLAHTAIAARPPGRRTRRDLGRSRPPCPGRASGPSGRGRRRRTRRRASAMRRPRRRSATSSRPSSVAAPACGLDHLGRDVRVDSSRPPGCRCGSARNPVSPGPAPSSRTVSPGSGPSSSTRRSETGRVADQISSRRRSQPAATERQASMFSSRTSYAVAPVNCGITCLPYASSVSSCPCVIR